MPSIWAYLVRKYLIVRLSRGNPVSILNGNNDDLEGSESSPGGFALGVVSLVIGMGVLLTFWAGISDVFYPGDESRARGLVYLLVTIPILFVTMNLWAKYLQGLFACAVLNATIMAFSGHNFGSPSVRIPPLEGLFFISFCVAATFLSRTFKDRKLRLLDRIAVLTFFSCVGYATTYEPTASAHGLGANGTASTLVMGGGLFCLSVAWAYDRFHQKDAKDQGPSLGGSHGG